MSTFEGCNMKQEVKEIATRGRSVRIMRGIMAVIVTAVALLSATRVEAQHTHQDYAFHPIEGVDGKVPKIRMEWGVGVGAAYTGIHHISTSEVKLKPRFGFQGHLDFAVRFGRHFAIEAEIAYEGGSIDAATEKVEHRVKTRTIDVPVLLSLRLANNIVRLTAGPVFTVMSRTEYTHEGEVMFYGPMQPTWNMAGGVAVGIGRNFVIEARYIHALVDTVNQFQGIEFSTRPYKITAGVTVLF